MAVAAKSLPAAGAFFAGNWTVSWDQGTGEDHGVILITRQCGQVLHVVGEVSLPRASSPEMRAAWVEEVQARAVEIQERHEREREAKP